MLGKRRLKPQEDAVLKIVYHTRGRPGPYEKRIYLFTNSSVQQKLAITLKGEVKPAPAARIKIQPRKINLGPVQKASMKKLNLRISNEGDRSLQISRIRGTMIKTVFDSNPDARIVLDPKESRILEIVFQGALAGPFVEVVFIDSNARNTLKGQYAVMLQGEVMP
ncbi:hypothetical protein ACFL7M_15415 [Thermodesulfobacteriota bacterium]